MATLPPDISVPGGIVHTKASPYVQELAKWELRPTELVSQEMIDRARHMPSGRSFVPEFHEYPKAMVRAVRHDGGPRIVYTDMPEAQSERHQAELERLGYHDSQEKAIAAIHAEDQNWAQLAAERNFHERRMSPNAQAEAARADDATARHLPSVPETHPGMRGEHVTSDREIALRAELDAMRVQLEAATAKPPRQGWPKGKPRGPRQKKAAAPQETD